MATDQQLSRGADGPRPERRGSVLNKMVISGLLLLVCGLAVLHMWPLFTHRTVEPDQDTANESHQAGALEYVDHLTVYVDEKRHLLSHLGNGVYEGSGKFGEVRFVFDDESFTSRFVATRKGGLFRSAKTYSFFFDGLVGTGDYTAKSADGETVSFHIRMPGPVQMRLATRLFSLPALMIMDGMCRQLSGEGLPVERKLWIEK